METVTAKVNSPVYSVIKRDRVTVQPYAREKIIAAVEQAWRELGTTPDLATINKVADTVSERVEVLAKLDNGTIDVEHIQDLVEMALMSNGHFDVAKCYIIYRSKRHEVRKVRLHPDPKAISDYIHPSKYGKYIEELKRRELFEETADRSMNMHLRKFASLFEKDPKLEEDIKWAFGKVKNKEVLPSGRSSQFAGKAIEVNNCRSFNCSATLIDRPKAFSEILFMLLCGCGVGYSVQFEHIEKLPIIKEVDKKLVRHHIIADTVEGWADALDALITAHIRGYYVEFSYHRIRDAGEPLKTSGGVAPGHAGLKIALERIRVILSEAAGRRLRPIEVSDIVMHSADAVLSGGVRRSSCIALFSLEDGEMMNSKGTSDWFTKHPWRANANISVALKRDEVKKKSFKRIFNMTKMYGEPGFIFVNSPESSYNPCQPDFATVLTPEGIRTFADITIGSTIWSGKRWTKVVRKLATGIKPIYSFHTRAGSFIGTENHRVVSDGEKIEVGQADSIDISVGGAEGGELGPRDIIDGLVLGDGSVHHASNDLVYLCVGKNDQDYLTSEIKDLLLKSRPGLHDGAWEIETTIKHSEIPLTYLRKIPDRFRFGNEKTVRGFLRGLYTANGSICGDRITLKASSLDVILGTQEMLSSIGIPSYYTTNKSHAVKFVNGEYECRESYDLNITGTRSKFRKLIGFIQTDKITRMNEVCDKIKQNGRAKTTFEIVSRNHLGDEPVYDITVDDDDHTYWTGGLLVSNCGEVNLNPVLTITPEIMEMIKIRETKGKWHPKVKLGDKFTGFQVCNLVELNAAKFTNLNDFLEAAKAGAIIATLQASYTEMEYLGWVSELINEREALIGVGMTGIMDSPDIALNPEYQRKVSTKVVEWNKEYAKRIGIKQSARSVVVKPSGTASLVLGSVASGIHPHHARRYIRRVTANALEPVFLYFKSINPQMCQKKNNGDWVIEFPVEAPDGAKVKADYGAIDFLEIVRSTQQNWVLPGTGLPESSPGYNNNVSNTVVVKENEWDAVAEYLWEKKEEFTCVSFLPDIADKLYSFAPLEEIKTEADEAKWNYLLKSYKPVDYSKMTEDGDNTKHVADPACLGGACAV
jgi:hypothetical protein